MIKETITFQDYNGETRTEDFYFNLTQAEAIEMELGVTGGLTETLNKIVQTKDTPSLMKIFKDIVLKAYGEKSADGRRFVKSEEISTAFAQTPAYSILFVKLATDADAAAKFMNGIVPASEDVKTIPAPVK